MKILFKLFGLYFTTLFISDSYLMSKTNLSDTFSAAYSAVKYKDGIVFTGEKDFNGISKMYFAKIQDKNVLGKPRLLNNQNSMFHFFIRQELMFQGTMSFILLQTIQSKMAAKVV